MNIKHSDMTNRKTLKKFFSSRQNEQAKRFGYQSDTPGYVIPVNMSADGLLSNFRVAVVQTLMPYVKDFSETHPTEWSPEYRAKHRAHLAATCRLISQKLRAGQVANRTSNENRNNKIDLIVFPELSVHPEDVDILERLSDTTNATIFAGLTFVKHPHSGEVINKAVWIIRQRIGRTRRLQRIYQGKKFPMLLEEKLGVVGHRPYQLIIEFTDKARKKACLTGSICFDATDLRLVADFREITDGYVIAALNKDISTFDNMAAALQFHMYQHVIIANTGEYGGSTAQAPYHEPFHRNIAHVHGNHQAAVSLFELDLLAFKTGKKAKLLRDIKSPPAGYRGR
ncbi:hypothetical protein [Arsukibacterium ikkense]|uniref:hypothetical protein n=1 Tax=Arsukibacterium ikkense TaxID=336831 RepID=UPI00069A8A98|nr:hypothetical protein [Arsukibacterium ikkense]